MEESVESFSVVLINGTVVVISFLVVDIANSVGDKVFSSVFLLINQDKTFLFKINIVERNKKN